MIKLTGKERSVLRSKAHHIRPCIIIGENGLSEGIIKSINANLKANELIKIKFKISHKKNKFMAGEIALHCNCQIIGAIGYIVILYRRNPKR